MPSTDVARSRIRLWTMLVDNKLLLKIDDWIREGRTGELRSVFSAQPALLHIYFGAGTWMHTAASVGNIDSLKLLIDLGCNVNSPQDSGKQWLPINNAIASGNPNAVRLLLENGADPNHDRIVISASVARKNSLAMVQILESFGANLHSVYLNEHTNKPMNALSTAIAWGKQDVVDYLRSKGAVLPDELIVAEAVDSLDGIVLGLLSRIRG